MKIYKVLKYIGLFICIAFMLGGVACSDDPFVGSIGNSKTDMVKISLSFTLPDQQVVDASTSQTRAVFENYIGDVFLMVFDMDDKFIECHQAVNASTENSFYASLTKQNKPCQIYVVANATKIVTAQKDGWNSETWLSDVQSQLLKASLVNEEHGSILEVPAMPPLSSIIPLHVEAIQENMAISDVTLERATAKIVISNEVGDDLQVDGANLCNAPVQGYVFAGQNINAITTADYWGESEGDYSLDYMIRRATVENPLYCYETTDQHGVFVIMQASYKGVDGYYRINLVDSSNKTLAIQRNHSYIIRVKKIQHPGYRTALEAKNNPALNAVSGNINIDIKDPYSHDIVSNGEYYLGVENSEFIFYSTSAIDGELVTMVHSNAPATAESGQVNMVAYDEFKNRISGLEVSNPFPAINNGTIHSGELRVKMPALVMSADIQLRVGNLEKMIKVTRKVDNLTFGATLPLDNNYVYGKISVPQSWIKFSYFEDINMDLGLDYVANPGGMSNIHLIMAPNLTLDSNSKNRETILYLSRASEKGRVKVKVFQPMYDIFEKESSPINNPYIGTFHRHNETGERVIKMGGTSISHWTAEVVIGKDFIKLIKGGSKDTRIYGPNPDDAENFQIYSDPDAKAFIKGEGEILFRVGLKDQIAENAHRYGVILVTHPGGISRIFVRQGEAPDYLYRADDPVLKGWTSHLGTPRPLTVKLSPYNLTDPALGAGISSTQIYSDHKSMPLDYKKGSESYQIFNEAKFTQYPTQAGYLFIWNTLTQPITGSEFLTPFSTVFKDEWQWVRAVHPIRPGESGQLWGSDRSTTVAYPGYNTYEGNYSGNGDGKMPKFDHSGVGGIVDTYQYTQIGRWYNEEADPCPYGYRLPKAGLVNKTPQGGAIKMYGQDAYYSELLQSMFYDPHISSSETEMSKYTLWGYYADGFFDRRQILTPNYTTDKTLNSMVVTGNAITNTTTGNDIGFMGGLTFNPFNYASIFHPAPGYWLFGMKGVGSTYHYWAADRKSTEAIASAIPLYLFATQSRFLVIDGFGSANFPKSIRCVRDPNISLAGHPNYD